MLLEWVVQKMGPLGRTLKSQDVVLILIELLLNLPLEHLIYY